jgi:hypothetical protein
MLSFFTYVRKQRNKIKRKNYDNSKKYIEQKGELIMKQDELKEKRRLKSKKIDLQYMHEIENVCSYFYKQVRTFVLLLISIFFQTNFMSARHFQKRRLLIFYMLRYAHLFSA